MAFCCLTMFPEVAPGWCSERKWRWSPSPRRPLWRPSLWRSWRTRSKAKPSAVLQRRRFWDEIYEETLRWYSARWITWIQVELDRSFPCDVEKGASFTTNPRGAAVASLPNGRIGWMKSGMDECNEQNHVKWAKLRPSSIHWHLPMPWYPNWPYVRMYSCGTSLS